jgi:hypothetical protein
MLSAALQTTLAGIITNTFFAIGDEDIAAPFCVHSERQTPVLLKSGVAGYEYDCEVAVIDSSPDNVETKKKLIITAIEALATQYNDWYLPSKDELVLMYGLLELTYDCMSSSEADNDECWVCDSGGARKAGKGGALYVRPCRSFTAAALAYSVGDTGPAGGKIIYVNGTDYIEASPSYISTTKAYSNIDDVAIGITGTAIGTGQDNTNKIIAQAGHIDSAAKACNDLTIHPAHEGTTIENVTYEGDDPGFDQESKLYISILRFTIQTSNI